MHVRLFMVVFATYTLCLVRLRLTAKLKLAKHFLLLIELFSTFSSISFVQMSTRTFSWVVFKGKLDRIVFGFPSLTNCWWSILTSHFLYFSRVKVKVMIFWLHSNIEIGPSLVLYGVLQYRLSCAVPSVPPSGCLFSSGWWRDRCLMETYLLLMCLPPLCPVR